MLRALGAGELRVDIGRLRIVSAEPSPLPQAGPQSVEEETLTVFVWRSIVPGFVATLLVSIGAFGVGWLPLSTSLVENPIVDALRSTTLGAVVGKGAVIVGVILLLQSWLLLGHDVMRRRVTSLPHLWLALGVWSLPLVVAPPLFSRDVYSYFAQGKLMVAGINPYTNGSSSVPGWFNDGVDPLWAEAKTPYGQFWLLLSKGVAEFIGPHPYSAALMLRLFAVIGVALLAFAVPKLAFLCGVEAPKALWLGVLNPLVLMHFISGAHNDALMAGLVVLGLLLAASHQAWLAVIVVTLAGSVKPVGLVALPFVGLLWAGANADWKQIIKRWLMVGVIAGAILLVLEVVTGTGVGWISALSTPGAVRTWLSPPTALAMLLGGIGHLFGLDVTDPLVTGVRLLSTLVLAMFLAWLCLRPQGRNPVRAAGLAFFALVVLGPVVQPWYLLWSLPIFAACGLKRVEFRIALIGSAGLTLFGLITSSATQDSLVQIPDLVAALIVAASLWFVLAVSPRERRLLLGDPEDDGTMPVDPPAIARARQLQMGDPSRPRLRAS